MTLLSEPALANKTYSRAKTCYQNQYVETYHPGTREKPGYVSSREAVSYTHLTLPTILRV